MQVSEAVSQRKSVRAFVDTPVADDLIKDLLTKANRAPSGGNVQPWRVFVLNGETTPRFIQHLAQRTEREQPEYAIYPKELSSPYRDSRFKVGEDMYALLGIGRDDKPARFAHLARNFAFFDAPAAFFCFVDRQMGPPQWSDLGMFLQSFMLLAEEAGLSTCAQEAWANRPRAVADFVGAGPELMLFCGMAIGYKDDSKPVNQLVSDRAPLNTWTKFV
jgi:nitroreductase